MIACKEIPAASIPWDLLLEADPSKSCVEKYLQGSLCYGAFVNGNIVGACVTNVNQQGTTEIFNIAVYPAYQKRGIGTQLLAFVKEQLAAKGVTKIVLGTGTFGYQLTFYQRLGFRVDEVVKDFFVNTHDQPIYEDGIQLRDMLRLVLDLGPDNASG